MRKNNIPHGLPYSQRSRYSNAAVNNIGSGLSIERDPGTPNPGTVNYQLRAYAESPEKGTVSATLVSSPTTVNVGSGAADFASGNSGSLSTGVNYPAGSVVKVWAKANQGWKFAGWNSDINGRTSIAQNTMTLKMDRNYLLVARFVPDTPATVTHTVTAKPNDPTMGSVSGIPASGSMTVNDRATVSLTAHPAEGCHFVKWEGHNFAGTPTNESATVTFTCASDHNLTAIFAKDANPGGGNGGETPPDLIDPGTNKEEPGNGGGNGGNNQPIVGGSATIAGFDVMAFVKKWWWALLIGAYFIYKEWKGARE